MIKTKTKKQYIITDSHLYLDKKPEDKKYVLTIRDLPEDQKPREKMLAYGVSTLTTQELLALVLNSGSKKEGILEMAGRILKDYGEKTFAGKVDPGKLASDLDIPLLKAMQIVACFELGRRFFEKKSSQMPTLRTAQDVFEYLADMRSLPKEHLRGLYLNSHFKLIHDEVVSIGTIDANIIHPREVFRPALEYGAVALILAHNHPSGSTHPSDADKAVTDQLIEVGKIMGVRLLDHIIICKDTFGRVEADY